MATGTEVLGAAVLVVEAAAAATVAVRIARRYTPPDLLDRLVVTALVGLAQVVGVPLLLACVDLLGRWPVLAGHLVVLAVAIVVVHPAPDEGSVSIPRRPLALLAIATVTAVTWLWARLSLQSGPPADFDTREYHVSNLASWFQRHNLWHLPYANPGYITATHPGNGEMAALWLILPTGHDQLAYVSPLLFALLAVLAVAFLTRELGGSASAGAIVGTAAIAAPLFFINGVRTIQTDEPAAAGFVLAAALVIRYRRDRATAWLALAGISLGLGIGSKYTVVLPAALLGVIALVMVKERARLLWALPGVLAFAGPWLLRNAIVTGNPIFPEQVSSILPGGKTTIDVFSTRMASHILHWHSTVLRSWWRIARTFFGPAGLLPIAGIALAWRRRTPQMLAVALLAVGSVVAYLATPYTGGGANGYVALLGSNQRYLLPAVLLGCALFAAALPEVVAAAVALIVFAYDLWWEVQRQALRADIKPGKAAVALALVIGAVAAGVIAVLPSAVAGWRDRRRNLPIRAGAAATALVLAFVGSFAILHHLRSVTLNPVEVVLDRIDGKTAPVAVIGVGDLRSVLGEDLRRPLTLVAAGGKANEEPFSDRAEVVRRYVSSNPQLSVAPTAVDEALSRKLNAALLAAGRPVLVVGPATSISAPAGWSPDRSAWCLVQQFTVIGVYARIGSPAATFCASH